MKIKIRAEKHSFTIPIPNGLIMNGFAAKLGEKILSKELGNKMISKEQLNLLFKDIKNAKKLLRDTPLVYVKSNNGEEVIINL